jgi:cell fate regulator YaaT (PSP1 superfamily)
MFSLTTSTTFAASTKRFKKFGKKMKKQRQDDLGRIGDRFKDIARDEERRAKEIFKEHQEFFQDAKGSQKKEEVAIDFFEN